MLDLGVILQAPMEDEAWLKKCALMGLMTIALFFVPIVGVIIGSLNALGWMRSYAEARMRGEKELPEVGLSYIGPGWRMFLMYLPIAGLIIAGSCAIGGVVAVGAAMNSEAIAALGGIVGALAFMPVMLWLVAFGPAMIYLHVVHGEQWASMRFSQQWALARQTGQEYLLLWVAFLLCGVITQLGLFACGVGLVVTMFYGYAMQGAAIAEYARVTKNT